MRMRYTEEHISWVKDNVPNYTCMKDLHAAFNKQFNLTIKKSSFISALYDRGIKVYTKAYPQEQIDWIVKNIPMYACIKELHTAFNKQFNLRTKQKNFESIMWNRNIRTNYINSSRLPTLWTEDRLDWLRNNKDKYSDRRILIKDFNKQFGCSITLKQLHFCKKYYKINFNKKVYTEQLHYPGRNYKHNPIGSISKRGARTYIKYKNDFQFISSKDSSWQNYKLKHVYLYEQYNSCVVNDDECVVFIDGNNENYSKENLYKISKTVQPLLITMIYTYLHFSNIYLILWCEHRVLLNKYLKEDNFNVPRFLRDTVFKVN